MCVCVCVTHQIIQVWMAADRLRNSRRKPWWSCRTTCRNRTQMTSTGWWIWAISTNFLTFWDQCACMQTAKRLLKGAQGENSRICGFVSAGWPASWLVSQPSASWTPASRKSSSSRAWSVTSPSTASFPTYSRWRQRSTTARTVTLLADTRHCNSQERRVQDWWVSAPSSLSSLLPFSTPFRLVCWYCMVQILTSSFKQSGGIQDDHECFLVCLFWVNTVVLWVVNSHWTDKKKKNSSAAATFLTFLNDFVTLWIG